jgi:hypothetical protein
VAATANTPEIAKIQVTAVTGLQERPVMMHAYWGVSADTGRNAM